MSPSTRILSLGRPQSPEGIEALAAVAALPGVQLVYAPDDLAGRPEIISWMRREIAEHGGFAGLCFWLSQIFKLIPFDEELVKPLVEHNNGARLRCICGPGAGFEKMPIDYLSAHAIFYSNTPGAVAETTAAHTVILVLTTLRGTTAAERSLRRGEWISGGSSVANKTLGRTQVGLRLGIVGMGSIGRVVSKYLGNMGMRVSYHNRRRLPEAQEGGATYVSSLEELLKTTDVLSVHVPLSPATKGLIGAKELALLPPRAIVINTSRGPLVDEAALIEALQSDRLAGAGLDVFDVESSAGIDPYLVESDRVVLTPHFAANIESVVPGFETELAENVKTFLLHGKPESAVNSWA